MEQAVHPVQVHEGTEIGDVLDNALADLANLDFRKQLLLLLAAPILQQLSAGENDIAAILVDLENLELELPVQEIVRIANRQNIQLGTRQERIDADIDDHAALHAALDNAFDKPAFLAGFKDPIPAPLLLGLGLAEHDHAVVVFQSFQKHFDVVAHLNLGDIFELGGGYDAFGFVADVDENFGGTNFEDPAFDDRSFGEILEGIFVHLRHCGAFITLELLKVEIDLLFLRFDLFHNNPVSGFGLLFNHTSLEDSPLITQKRVAN